MTESINRYESAMLGHALANNIQASTYLAIELSKCLRDAKKFEPTDVMTRYMYRYYKSECRMGEVMGLVFEELREEKQLKKENISKKDCKYSLERIHQASQNTHQKLNGLSAGCSPALRSYPLALCPYIDDDNLFDISCQEAHLTHYSPQSGQVAGIVNLILRRLIKGDEWNDAIMFAFDKSSSSLTRDIKEIQQRYPHDLVLDSKRNFAFAPNVLHIALHCITNNNSYEAAVDSACTIEGDYCPTLVGLLAGARWGVPQSIVNNSHSDQIKVLKDHANYFTKKWASKRKKA